MRAADVMTPDPVCISPDASINDAIRLLLERKFSGLPVVDARGSLVGIVTEGDLLRRTETGTQRKRPSWIEFLMGPGRLATEYVQTTGRKVNDVMTPEVRTVTEDARSLRSSISWSATRLNVCWWSATASSSAS